jgi:tetratricopeptide (TPR) repeat protein
MSLVLDNLKKLKKQSGAGSVPPGMINLAPKRKKKGPNKVLLILLVFAIVGFGLTFLLDDGGNKYTVAPPVRTVNKPKPAAKPPVNQPAQQPAETADAGAPPSEAANPAEDEAAIQARIDAAVQKALQQKDAADMDTIEKSRTENKSRIAVMKGLPEQAKPKTVQASTPAPAQKETPAAEAPAAEKTADGKISADPSVLMQQAKNLSQQPVESQATAAPAETAAVAEPAAKPAMTEEQRAAYKKKVEYNTMIIVGDRALNSGSYQKAVENYEKAMSQKPTPALLVRLVKSRLSVGDADGAVRTVDKYKKHLDDSVLSVIASELDDAGFKNQSLSLLGSYQGVFETDSKLYYTAGQIHEKHSDYAKAEAAYGKASELLPADGYYAYAYARMLDTNKKYEEAVKAYNDTLRLNIKTDIRVPALNRSVTLSNYIKMLKEQEKMDAENSLKE